MDDASADVTRVRRASQAAAGSEARFRALAQSQRDLVVLVYDDRLRFTVATGDTGRLLGCGPDDVVGRTLGDLLPREKAILQTPHYRDALEGRQHALDLAGVGATVWDTVFTPVPDEAGNVVAGMAVARDVTETRRKSDEARRTQARLEAIVDNTTAAIFMKDVEGHYLLANGAAERALGMSRQHLATRTDYDVLPPEAAHRVRAADRQCLASQSPLYLEEELRWPDGSVHTYLTVRFALRDAQGNPHATCGIATDITDRKRADRALHDSEERFTRVFDEAPIGIVLGRVQPDGTAVVLRVNTVACELTGYSRGELMSMDAWGLVPDADRERLAVTVRHVVSGERRRATVEHRIHRADGATRLIQSSLSRVGDPAGDDPILVAHIEDITDRRLVEIDLRRRVTHDELTGLPNRTHLQERLAHALDRMRRRPSMVGVLYVDVDDFKTINDRFGHGTGDKALVGVAGRLLGILRRSDTAARLSGDEFVVLCEDLEDERAAVRVADRIVSEMADPDAEPPVPVPLSVSVGIAVTREDAFEPERLLSEADAAMQTAKRKGKSRHEMSPLGASTEPAQG